MPSGTLWSTADHSVDCAMDGAMGVSIKVGRTVVEDGGILRSANRMLPVAVCVPVVGCAST
eukprot:10913790-Heterocapsa_arctica.AAC.1